MPNCLSGAITTETHIHASSFFKQDLSRNYSTNWVENDNLSNLYNLRYMTWHNVNPSSAKALSKPNKWWCRLFGNSFKPDTKPQSCQGRHNTQTTSRQLVWYTSRNWKLSVERESHQKRPQMQPRDCNHVTLLKMSILSMSVCQVCQLVWIKFFFLCALLGFFSHPNKNKRLAILPHCQSKWTKLS